MIIYIVCTVTFLVVFTGGKHWKSDKKLKDHSVRIKHRFEIITMILKENIYYMWTRVGQFIILLLLLPLESHINIKLGYS